MKIVENDYYRILVCGGRHFNEFQVVDSVVNKLIENLGFDYSQVEIVSGHCDGADKLGEKFAEVYNTHLRMFPANWTQYGRAAGPIRNKAMVDYINKAEHKTVVAFVSKNSKGTKNTVELAKKLNIPVIEIKYDIFESNSTLYEGVSYSDGTFNFNWDSDTKDDIVSLTGTITVLTLINN